MVGNEATVPTPGEPGRATLAADAVLFARDSAGVLHVLLVRRRWAPFEGCWALPGGMVEFDGRDALGNAIGGETFEQAARRELAEETGILAPASFEFVGLYDAADRDPRARVVSAAFVGVLSELVTPQAADDAAAARWVPYTEIMTDIEIMAAGEIDLLAFDHAEILRDAATMLRSTARPAEDNALCAGLPGQGTGAVLWPAMVTQLHDTAVRLEADNARLTAERDDLMRQVENAAWDLNDVLSGRPVSSVGALFTDLERGA